MDGQTLKLPSVLDRGLSTSRGDRTRIAAYMVLLFILRMPLDAMHFCKSLANTICLFSIICVSFCQKPYYKYKPAQSSEKVKRTQHFLLKFVLHLTLDEHSPDCIMFHFGQYDIIKLFYFGFTGHGGVVLYVIIHVCKTCAKVHSFCFFENVLCLSSALLRLFQQKAF